MIKYQKLSLTKVEQLAFDPSTKKGTALIIQDLLIRMKNIKKQQGLEDDQFVFLQNPQTGLIKMEIV